ncbi:MlaD family protein [Lentilitoribacter sp. Alg239-R112]|uniref:MlaD family protein n=1 Tax=Lentilitoribacter sp. Alg239-R112 TaxID=2305987 RepID=UPI0013A7043A|nr:MlaD family protein [Lentilitoribacter sp. Alg239-R112]
METKANYTIVGLFAIIVTFAAFGFIYWYAELSQTGNFAKVIVRVPGSAAGLNVGSPVRFNGIPVGQVKSVQIDFQRPKYVVAIAEVSVDMPMNDTTVFKLESQGLTGASLFEVSTPTGSGTDMLRKAFETDVPIEIEAQTSGIAGLIENAETIMVRANSILGEVEGFVKDAQAPITNTLKNAEAFSEAIAKNSEGIDQFLASVTGLTATVQTLSLKLETTLNSADRLITAIEPKKINNTLSNFETLSANATQSLAKIDALISEVEPGQIDSTIKNVARASADAKEALNQAKIVISGIGESTGEINQMITDVSSTAKQLNKATAKVDTLLAEVKPEQISNTMNNITVASNDAKVALSEARKIAESIGGKTSEIEDLISNVNITAKKLSDATEKVDTLLAEVDPTLVKQTVADISAAGADAKQTLADAKEIVGTVGERSEDIDQMITDVSELAGRLNGASARIDGVLAKLDGFLGDNDSGSLIADAQETLKSFKDVADNLNKRIGPIAGNLERFTGSGLKDIEALVTEARRSISRIERSVSSIERDPQRLLFGGESVKQFDGRTRR